MATEKRTFKTRKTLSMGNLTYRKWDDYAEGDYVIGTVLDKTHTDKYKKECRIVEVIEAHFADGTGDDFIGKELVLNASGGLNKSLDGVSAGDMIEITYDGKAVIKGGEWRGEECHVHTVKLVEEESEQDDVDL